MTPEQKHQSIRALSRKMEISMLGKDIEVCGAALSTAIGVFLIKLGGDEKTMLAGLDAIKGDAASFIKMAHAHKGTKQ
ncbi:MAG: hypothetical protein JNK47_12825 [Mesorhizobium sp.]|nr:hypothetical protein [Mesorhizobium sp.]MBL8578103.1 hypothetical protein [Mesorhizobium sp.]